MNTILLIIIGILLTVELGMIMFCEYWRENNPWKWFIIKTVTTLLIVIYLISGSETFSIVEFVFVSIISTCLGIDFTCTYIDTKKKDNFKF